MPKVEIASKLRSVKMRPLYPVSELGNEMVPEEIPHEVFSRWIKCSLAVMNPALQGPIVFGQYDPIKWL